MAVITGSGAEELDLFFLAPGTGRVQQTVGVGTGNDVAHHVQRSGAANKDLACLTTQNICPVSTGGGQTGQFTVVTGVNVAVEAIFHGGQGGQNITDQIQLPLAGLAPGHIKIQIFLTQVFIPCNQLYTFHTKFFSTSARIGSHTHHPFLERAII
jgi:hypothetical protein